MPATELGMVRIHKRQSMTYEELIQLPWWEQEKHLTEKDKEAIHRAGISDWEYIDENWAETPLGKKWVHDIATTKYHREEYAAGLG